MSSFLVNGIQFSKNMVERLPILNDIINAIGEGGQYDIGADITPRLLLVEPYARTDPLDYVLPQDSQATLEALDYFGVNVSFLSLKTARQLRQESQENAQFREKRMAAFCMVGKNKVTWIMFIPLDLAFPEPVPSRDSPGTTPPFLGPFTTPDEYEEETESERVSRLKVYEDRERLATTADFVNLFEYGFWHCYYHPARGVQLVYDAFCELEIKNPDVTKVVQDYDEDPYVLGADDLVPQGWSVAHCYVAYVG